MWTNYRPLYRITAQFFEFQKKIRQAGKISNKFQFNNQKRLSIARIPNANPVNF